MARPMELYDHAKSSAVSTNALCRWTSITYSEDGYLIVPSPVVTIGFRVRGMDVAHRALLGFLTL